MIYIVVRRTLNVARSIPGKDILEAVEHATYSLRQLTHENDSGAVEN